MKSFFAIAVRFTRSGLAKWLAGGTLACLGTAALTLHFWLPEALQPEGAVVSASASSDEPIQPIAALPNLDAGKVELGRKLFHDPRLSHSDELSCASCHDVASGGADSRVHSIGIYGAVSPINTPTVLNSGFNFSQFWDGRAETLEQQVDGPVLNHSEMGSTWKEVIDKLKRSPDYVKAFRQIYAGDIEDAQIKDSIAVFERSLTTPNSRFDRYLRHDDTALTSREQKGYELFKTLGCVSCHQGVNIGGNMYQKLGVMAPYFTDRGHTTKADGGRFNVTGDPDDMHMFKVPTLRNIELTAPYFHDGNAKTLDDAVRMMAKYQLGRELSNEEVGLIVEFLKTLTGELNGKPL